MNLREYAEIVTSSNTLIDAYVNLQEAKDYKYKAKVGNLWLAGKSLKKSRSEGDEFESETEPRQRINQLKRDGRVAKNSEVTILKVEENTHRFTEADKSRFIKPLFAKYGKNYAVRINLADELGIKTDDLPAEETVIKWVNSGAADKFQFDWQNSDNREFFKSLIRNYVTYTKNKKDNNKRTNPKKLFEDEDLFYIVGESEDWLFVAPLSHEAAIFMDSFKCGGAGAKWCIGYEESDRYWREHVFLNKNLFIMAYNKNTWGSYNNQKYMMQFMQRRDSLIDIRAWPQDDDPGNTKGSSWCDKVFKTDTAELYHTLKKVWEEKAINGKAAKIEKLNEIDLYDQPEKYEIGSSVVNVLISDPYKFNQFTFYDILEHVVNIPSFYVTFDIDIGQFTENDWDRVLGFDFLSMLPMSNTSVRDRIQDMPTLCIKNAKSIKIRDLYIDGEKGRTGGLVFSNCGKVEIDTIHISNDKWLPDTFTAADILDEHIYASSNTQIYVDKVEFNGNNTMAFYQDEITFPYGEDYGPFKNCRSRWGDVASVTVAKDIPRVFIDMYGFTGTGSEGVRKDCDLNEVVNIPEDVDNVHVCIANAIGDYKVLPLDKPGVKVTYRFKNCDFENKDISSFVRA